MPEIISLLPSTEKVRKISEALRALHDDETLNQEQIDTLFDCKPKEIVGAINMNPRYQDGTKEGIFQKLIQLLDLGDEKEEAFQAELRKIREAKETGKAINENAESFWRKLRNIVSFL